MSIFHKLFADKVCFYFDEVIDLYDFHQWAMRRDILREAHFCYSIYPWVNYYHYDNGIPYQVTAQPWCDQGWTSMVHWAFENHSNLLQPDFVIPEGWHSTLDICRFKTIVGEGRGSQITVYHTSAETGVTLALYMLPTPRPNGSSYLSRGKTKLRFSGKIKDLTFNELAFYPLHGHTALEIEEGYDFHDQHNFWGWPHSPDLEADERMEMDQDSWAVPDRKWSPSDELNGPERVWKMIHAKVDDDVVNDYPWLSSSDCDDEERDAETDDEIWELPRPSSGAA
jgi:hypothetical protein